jgi:Mlc titration factor MtfA (ptsG expression regulator)
VRWRRRRAQWEAGFLPEWDELLARRIPLLGRLSGDERERLEQLALGLMIDTRWEAANGFVLTDEIRVTIAAQAALLVLGLPDDSFRLVQSILVHPTTMVMSGEHSQVNGLASREPMPIVGLAEHRGPVVIAWDTARDDARHPGTGHNVVFHEFAHQLDMLDGTVDGTPPLATQDQFDRWVEVCTRVYHQVEAGTAGHALSSYAGVNTGEFFAVATEVFFDDPHALIREHRDLYEVMAEFYRQDPAARTP